LNAPAGTEGARYFRAPGRINIIGEHTDYNAGLVLPMATGIYTTVVAIGRDDRKVTAKSKDLDLAAAFSLDDCKSLPGGEWIAYVRGVAAELQAAGVSLRGANLLIESEIPIGAGLSSSAALELAVGNALLAVAGTSIKPNKMAKICQLAEQRHAGVQCGIMDQYTVACAREGHALLLDCRSLETEDVPVADDFSFLVVDSGVRHRHPEGSYNDRAAECSAAVRILAQDTSGLKSLRDAGIRLLDTQRDALGDVLYRRCRHVVTENMRVAQAVAALRSCSVDRLGALLDESHISLRDDYEVSCPEVDTLVELAGDVSGVSGARMIGGGFGGCVLVLAGSADIHDVAESIREAYVATFDREPWMHHVTPASPAQEFSRP
jgi:galactokinase